jgi:hypothetical protein
MNLYEPPFPDAELHRLCRFSLALTCGHRVIVDLNGWYPVCVPCCDRLGGTVLCGRYLPYSSAVEYATVIEERYEWRAPASAREPMQVIDREPRTDLPRSFGKHYSAGRFPQHIGSAWLIGRNAT